MRISDWSSDVCSSDLFNIDMAGLQMIVFMKGGKSRAQPPPGKELMAGPRLYSVTMALPAIIESDRENSDWIEFSGSEPVIEIVKERNGKGGDRKSTRLNSSH